ncbi:MAG: hypothetical protein ING50_08155 [Burkholderiales bacterium]|nr:hypothetical protein [Burkholderiales bacterium]
MDFAMMKKSVHDFWDWAFKRSPAAARLLFGGYLLLAITGLIAASTTSLGALFKTALVLLAFSIAVALAVKGLSRGKLSLKAEAFVWCLVTLMVIVLALFVSSAFLGLPERGAVIVARLFDLPELLSKSKAGPDQALTANNGRWPAEVTSPLDVDGDRYARLDALRKRPSLTLTSDRPARGGGTIAVDTLYLKGDVVVTDGQPLTIEAAKVVSEEGRIRGLDGSASSPGSPMNGGNVTLIVQDRIVGKLAVDLSGRAGADGKAGATGGKGGTGAAGDNAASGLVSCLRGAGPGQTGGKGLKGGNGGNGGDGGHGGTLIVAGTDPSSLLRSVEFMAKGGAPGKGGSQGSGGPGGDGGSGGGPRGLCEGGGQPGASGAQGDPGEPGNDGKSGSDGAIVPRKLDAKGTLP